MNRLSIALVSTLSLLAAAATPAAATRLAKETSYSKSISNVGGGYYAGASVEGNRRNGRFEFDARAAADVSAKLFGNNIKVANVLIYAQNDAGGAEVGAGIYAAGIKLWGAGGGTSFEREIEVPVYGASFKKNFKVWGVKLKVKASAGGVAGLGAGASVSHSGLEIHGGPYVSTGVSASAGVGTKGAKVSVGGSMTLARIDAVGQGELSWDNSGKVTATARFGFDLNFLAGEMKLKIKLFGKTLGRWELFGWSGLNKYVQLGSASTSWQL